LCIKNDQLTSMVGLKHIDTVSEKMMINYPRA
jgi:hypothetical protein